MWTICPRHRDSYGIRWRTGKTRCTIPPCLSGHATGFPPKGTRGVSILASKLVYESTGVLIPIGSPICRKCREHLAGNVSQASTAEEADDDQVKIEMALEESHAEWRLPTPEIQPSTCFNQDDPSEPLKPLELHSPVLSPISSAMLSTPCEEQIRGRVLDTPDTPYISYKKEKFNCFLQSCSIPPVNLDLDLSRGTERTQRRYITTACEVVAVVLETLSPTNPSDLWQAVRKDDRICERFDIPKSIGIKESDRVVYLKALAESYMNATSSNIKRQVLSIIADLTTLREVRQFIPGLTKYMFCKAREHHLEHGRGIHLISKPTPRVRYDVTMLDHFLDFITSPYIIQDLPFGQKQLKLSSGETLQTPNVIRMSVNERIISQYGQYCEENGLTPLSPSTLRRVLSACSASVRKCLQGLDSFAADGSKAFDELLRILDKLVDMGVDCYRVQSLKTKLKEGRNYLKADYKVHVLTSSPVPDHCSQFALSDSSDPPFKAECSHDHDMRCDRCDGLKYVLGSIEAIITENEFETQSVKEDTVFTFEEAVACIHNWKSHLLRTVNQDRARVDIIENLGEDRILLIQDWAMKFLPRQYRESQGEWFAKRGLSWHITVAIRKKDGTLEKQAFVHVVDECTQDSPCVVALVVHILRTIHHENPEITRAFYRQDNAGCYHCVNTLLALPIISKRTGIKIERVDFSDPQGGKGPCDRMAATLKQHVRAYINEGHSVCSTQELKEALLSNGGVPGVRIALLSNPHATKLDSKIPGISKLNDFSFADDSSVRVWRAYGVGEGKEIDFSEVGGFQVLNVTTTEGRFSDGAFHPLNTRKRSSGESRTGAESEVTLPNPQDVVEAESGSVSSDGERNAETNPKLYVCPHEGCCRSYQSYSAMEHHVAYGKCTYREEKETLLDKAKKGYSERLMAGQSTSTDVGIQTIQQSLLSCDETLALEEGWALRKKKKTKPFTDKQKAFLEEKFMVGETSGKKLDAATVSRQMKLVRDDEGSRLFPAAEVLTTTQIQGYFSRRAKCSSQDKEDFEAAQVEDAMAVIRSTVISETTPSHPLVYDGYNVCELVSRGRLSNLTLAVLRNICRHFQLEVEETRRKAPLVSALEEMVQACSCTAASS